MVQSVLGSLILGYRPLWNRARKLAAIQLYVHSEASALVDTDASNKAADADLALLPGSLLVIAIAALVFDLGFQATKIACPHGPADGARGLDMNEAFIWNAYK